MDTNLSQGARQAQKAENEPSMGQDSREKVAKTKGTIFTIWINVIYPWTTGNWELSNNECARKSPMIDRRGQPRPILLWLHMQWDTWLIGLAIGEWAVRSLTAGPVIPGGNGSTKIASYQVVPKNWE